MSTPLAPGSLAGIRALVTGSSRGIGADTARYLAEAGAGVVINYRNKEARALKLVAEIEAAGGTAFAVGADLTNPDDVARFVEEVRTALGGLDLLVLNASGGMEAGMGEDYAMRLNRDAQIGNGINIDSCYHCGFLRIFLGHQQVFNRSFARQDRNRQCALDRSHTPIER